MLKSFLSISILFFCITSFSQNEFQSQLYILHNRLTKLEKESLLKKSGDNAFFTVKLDLVKDFHRLQEETMQAQLDKNIDSELANLISLTSEIGCNRLDFLANYLQFRKDLYKINYDRSKIIYLSLYLKVKNLETN